MCINNLTKKAHKDLAYNNVNNNYNNNNKEQRWGIFV